MSADDPHDPTDPDAEPDDIEPADLRAELDRQRGQATRPANDGEDVIDLLSAAFDTDRRTRVYVALRRDPDSTVDELVEATGLYPTAVERVLSDLDEEGVVERRAAAGNGTVEYTAIAPQEAMDVAFGRVQDAIDDRFGLDRSREGRSRDPAPREGSSEPVTIPVEKDDGDADAGTDTDSDSDPGV